MTPARFFMKVPVVLAICGACLAVALFMMTSKVDASGGGGGSSNSNTPTCPPFSSSPPVAEAVAGYVSSAPAKLYDATKDNYRGTIPSSVLQALYNGMPAPGTCGNGSQGLCITNRFGSTQGTRVAALTAVATNLTFGNPSPIQASVDAVTSKISNACGETSTHWSWSLAPASAAKTAYFPKDTDVQVSYSCQPSQTYAWTTSTSCFLGIGTCNTKRHARTFFFSSEAKSNIPSVSGLYGQTNFVPQDSTAYTLSCGGYRPENGDGPPLHGSANKDSGVCFLGIDCNGGTDFGYYNTADASYWQPGISLSVQICSGDDDIVVDNVCTPCSQVNPGSHRIDNVCVKTDPKLGIKALVNGASVDTVTAGTKVTLQATYVTDSSDPIKGVDITGGTNGSAASVCGSKSCLSTSYNGPKSAATSTYSFTPAVPGVYTYYPQVQTKTLNALRNYGGVSKTLTVTAPCPSNATPSGNTCTCNEKYFAFIGNACVLVCPTAMHNNKAGNSCISNLPSAASIVFSAARVRANTPSTLTWSVGSIGAGVTCDIAPHAGLADTALAWPAGSAKTVPITAPTSYTLTCTNGEESVSTTATVTLIPEYQEI